MPEKTSEFYIKTIGCPRNDSDSEAIINLLVDSGYELIESPEHASYIIVNTCAFIESAVKESIETILFLSKLNPESKIIVVGCLPQRYRERLKKEIPEIDIMLGTGSIHKISKAIRNNKSYIESNKGYIDKNAYSIHRTTPPHYRYIKIQEGCDFNCSFCIIPILKGKNHSKSIDNIKEEIENMDSDVREIILIGQNTSSWGIDIYGKSSLHILLNEISPLFPHWIRILYLHPLHITENLLETINNQQNLLNYLDIPFQHVSSRILKTMNRGYGKKQIFELINLIGSTGKFTLRTTFITGFPGESEGEFKELYNFIEKEPFEHIGLFEYSGECEALSYKYHEIDKKIKKLRYKEIFSLIRKKMTKNNRKKIGKCTKVLIDGEYNGEYYGRNEWYAPDIDEIIWVNDNKDILTGEFYDVKITDSLESELMGEII